MRSPEELHRAINCFRRAIDIDPSYALAYSGLACSYSLLPMLAPVPSASCMPRAKTAAIHALEIDGTLLEARSVLAFVTWHYDWKWKAAERELRRMLKFEPGDAVAHVWYALLLAERGRFSDAVAEARRAQSLDSMSASLRANVATVLHFCGRHEEAVEEATEAIAVDPASVRAHFVLGLAREQQDRMPEAVAALETAVAVSKGTNPAMLGALGHALARSRKIDAAEQTVKALDELHPGVTSWAKALVRLGMDDHCETLRLLGSACESREFGLVTLGIDKRLLPLRRAAGFRQLLEHVGLNA
jgi:tetratricopeptide (TPR) repeat protein